MSANLGLVQKSPVAVSKIKETKKLSTFQHRKSVNKRSRISLVCHWVQVREIKKKRNLARILAFTFFCHLQTAVFLVKFHFKNKEVLKILKKKKYFQKPIQNRGHYILIGRRDIPKGNESISIFSSYYMYSTVRDCESQEKPSYIYSVGRPGEIL